MTKILSAVSCNLDKNILSACLPLFEEEKIEGLEWSFDTLYAHKEVPDWFSQLLHAFGAAGRLIGHGVYFSLFSGRWTTGQQAWLAELKKASSAYRFDHVSEHFGFMTGRNFHHGAPISIPYTTATLALGRDRLKRISQVCGCPVGLENLAFSYSPDEVKKHGEFLEQLLLPVNGFVILDLHNLYCQCHNFAIPFQDLLKLYPLQRVREIHISGGSWENSDIAPHQRVRRDTHDESVPEEVFTHLSQSLPFCPNLKYVVLEQLGSGLSRAEEQRQFREDFLRMCRLVSTANETALRQAINSFLPGLFDVAVDPAEDEELYQQQAALSAILESAADRRAAAIALQNSPLARSGWNVEEWQPHMLQTAISIAQKWKNGFRSKETATPL